MLRPATCRDITEAVLTLWINYRGKARCNPDKYDDDSKPDLESHVNCFSGFFSLSLSIQAPLLFCLFILIKSFFVFDIDIKDDADIEVDGDGI